MISGQQACARSSRRRPRSRPGENGCDAKLQRAPNRTSRSCARRAPACCASSPAARLDAMQDQEGSAAEFDASAERRALALIASARRHRRALSSACRRSRRAPTAEAATHDCDQDRCQSLDELEELRQQTVEPYSIRLRLDQAKGLVDRTE